MRHAIGFSASPCPAWHACRLQPGMQTTLPATTALADAVQGARLHILRLPARPPQPFHQFRDVDPDDGYDDMAHSNAGYCCRRRARACTDQCPVQLLSWPGPPTVPVAPCSKIRNDAAQQHQEPAASAAAPLDSGAPGMRLDSRPLIRRGQLSFLGGTCAVLCQALRTLPRFTPPHPPPIPTPPFVAVV